MIWPPYPYAAGFCVTDDPDAATFEQTKAVYDFLRSRSFVTTRAVWPFIPTRPCGIPPTPESTLRGVTLQDDRFLAYCQELGRDGYELCLHGASAGNNTRQKTLEAFEFLSEHALGSDTYICHSKNAENIYWGKKVTSIFPFRALVGMNTQHAFSGEIQESEYFWGDLCASRINQIRLFRTRCTNTLRSNPSMPYHDTNKPLVNGWFSATKRSLADCASQSALDRLKREHGLTILYQYLHRYADASTLRLDETLVRSVEAISSDSQILVATVSAMMKRLRLIQGTFVAYEESSFWLINVNDEPVNDLQIVLDYPVAVEESGNARSLGRMIHVKSLAPRSLFRVRTSEKISFKHKRARPIPRDRHVLWNLSSATLCANLGDTEWLAPDGTVLLPCSFTLECSRTKNGIPLLSELSTWEETLLACGQFFIIVREVIFKGRSLRTDRYLDSSRRIPLEDHGNW
jgi:hypothetical protein